jgi:hypothetical protein
MGLANGELYDGIGATYIVTRRTEPRIATQLWAALGDARTGRRGVSVWAGVGPDTEKRAVHGRAADADTRSQCDSVSGTLRA